MYQERDPKGTATRTKSKGYTMSLKYALYFLGKDLKSKRPLKETIVLFLIAIGFKINEVSQ